MMGMYAQRFRMRGRYGGGGRESPPTIGHDRVNYINPTINYDKFPRKIRPKRGRSNIDSDVSLNSPNRSRRCSCMENLNLTSEQLTALRRHSHDHTQEDEDAAALQQQQTDEILHASADVLTRMFTCLNTSAHPPPKDPPPLDPRYSRPGDKLVIPRHGGRYHTRPWRTRVPGALEMERKVARGASRTPPPWPPVATSGDTSGTPSRAPSDIDPLNTST
ncbi:uncharacterized protein LOC121869369 [Homarus americanus]|uniref:uncharacterized protein LOC121869369 n=1 Tax=Homarus americanus TaxID=6706 RepID=UPI001C495391|nr:uncharacterized protein LOC121869369 [Homarus americanus]